MSYVVIIIVILLIIGMYFIMRSCHDWIMSLSWLFLYLMVVYQRGSTEASDWMNEWMNETESSVKPGVTAVEWTTVGCSLCYWCLLGQDINIKKKNAEASLGWSRSKCRRHKYAYDCASCHKNAGQNHNIKWIWKIPSLKMWQNSSIVNSSDNAKLHLQRN